MTGTEASWSPDYLSRTARSHVRRALRQRDMAFTSELVEDLAQEAIARAIEKWNRSDKGPIVLVRWKAIDVVDEEVERRKEDEGVVMDERQMSGVWA